MDCWSPSLAVDDEFEKLAMRINPPMVAVDNASSRKATLIKVDSANKRGSLLEVVQVLNDLNLIIRRAYISSDGEWFMDVFHVTDQQGNKLSDDGIAERIQQSLGPRARSFRSLRRSVGVQAAAEHTTIELTGRDRPGLLSEVFAVLSNLKCNVVAGEVWTHNSRMASVVYITDEETGRPIDDPEHLTKIKQLLLYVLKGDRDKRSANTAVSVGSTHKERRLHQMMYADRDYDMDAADSGASDHSKPLVTVENCVDKGYTVVNLRCPDRPKLLFDTVCTLTNMEYVVYHATVIAEGPEAYQEYYIRHTDGCPISSEGERQRVIHCLEAAIRRQTSEGIRLELCGDDRAGLLSDVTRVFRENCLSVTRAEDTTRGSQAVNVFYVTDASGIQVKSETIEAVRQEIGLALLSLQDDFCSKSPPQESGRFSLGNLFRTRMMWGYLFPEEEQDSQRRQEVWKVSRTAGAKRVKKGSLVPEISALSGQTNKESEASSKASASAPATSQSSVHADPVQESKLQNLKTTVGGSPTRELRRTSSFDRSWEDTVAESVATELVLQSITGPLGSNEPDGSSKNKLKDPKAVKSGRSSHEEKKVTKSQEEKRSRPRKMMEFHNIKISQVELCVTYEGSRFVVNDLKLLMDTFHRVEFTGTWRRLFSRVNKHIIWGVLKSVTGMQGKKFKDKANSQREPSGSGVPDSDLNFSDNEGQPEQPDQNPITFLKRPGDGAGDGFVTSIRGLFNTQRRKAKAFVLRTMRGEAENDFQGDWSESDAEFSPFARQLTITKAKRLIRRHTKKFRSRKGSSSQQRDSLASSPRETTAFESDSSSGSSPYEDFNEANILSSREVP